MVSATNKTVQAMQSLMNSFQASMRFARVSGFSKEFRAAVIERPFEAAPEAQATCRPLIQLPEAIQTPSRYM